MLLAMQETQIGSLGQEDTLEKEVATRFSILAWEILWTEEPGGLQSMGLLRVRHDRATKHTYLVIIITLGKLNESNTCHETIYFLGLQNHCR